MIIENLYIFDCEVFAHDWLFVFKRKSSEEYTVIWNDNDTVIEFMKRNPVLAGFNNKHYDQFILKAVLMGYTPETIKELNDFIIVEGGNGWDDRYSLRNAPKILQYDLTDDCQQGLSLKAIEAHLGMNIQETEVDFNLNRSLTSEEKDLTVRYCKADVNATDRLDDLRQNYLANKLKLGEEIGLAPIEALSMTNAKLTARYLKATPPKTPWVDEREYRYPDNLRREYIPKEVFDFFNDIYNPAITSENLFSSKLKITVGGCPCTIAYGGIHGAIPCYRETGGVHEGVNRMIRNYDVASYYPHLMTLCGYTSRNIPNAQDYADMLERRIRAKKSGDKATANALKLVANTTYGAMLSEWNDLYDPLMGRSVCISGQLFLLELANHLISECKTLKVIQLNTDGIMVSFTEADYDTVITITAEWQQRTGFELEEDLIKGIVQKDVNNYVEIPYEGKPKIKGGVVVRGIAPAGAFNINNNAPVIAKAVVDYLANGTPVEQTINANNTILDYQLIAKSWAKCGNAWHMIHGKPYEIQRVNRVYATANMNYGDLLMYDSELQNYRKIPNLPPFCIVDNDNHLTISDIDKSWYIHQAQTYADSFSGLTLQRNTKRLNQIKKNIAEVLAWQTQAQLTMQE